MNAARSRTLAVILVMLVVLTGCKPKEEADAKATPIPVAVVSVTTKPVKDVIELDGSVSPFQQVNLVARVPGTLEQVNFKDGDVVTAGQVLAVIEQPPYVEQVNLNQAKLVQTQADYRRQTDLLRQNATSQSNVETSLSNQQQAQANLKIAQINLDYTVVKAPFDGIVGRRQVDPGNYVGATVGGTVLATVMQISPAYVYASIGERDAIRIRDKMAAGQNAMNAVGRAVVHARLQGDSGPGEEGVLDFIDHQVNQTTGTLQVRGRFQNGTRHLIPGFYAKLAIDVGPERQAVVLPSAIVKADQQGEFVFLIGDDKHAHRRNIVTAQLPGEYKEIVSGLKPGDQVVTEGANMLSEGQTVQIVGAGKAG